MSKISCGARGASACVTDSGPPERMMPRGANFFISSIDVSHEYNSQYTPASRTRRAISCVYCAPKSRIRIFWECGSVITSGTGVEVRDARVQCNDSYLVPCISYLHLIHVGSWALP